MVHLKDYYVRSSVFEKSAHRLVKIREKALKAQSGPASLPAHRNTLVHGSTDWHKIPKKNIFLLASNHFLLTCHHKGDLISC